jgi:predicted GNAT family N-acyltransferase
MSDGVEIRIARLAEIIDLRSDVLIRGTVRVSPQFDGDSAADTLHFGAFDGASNIACASCMQGEYENQPAWQLRGMATQQGRRSQGIGASLLAFIEDELLASNPNGLLWCNARLGAVGFYERAGWKTTGDVFEVTGVGPHREMFRIPLR